MRKIFKLILILIAYLILLLFDTFLFVLSKILFVLHKIRFIALALLLIWGIYIIPLRYFEYKGTQAFNHSDCSIALKYWQQGLKLSKLYKDKGGIASFMLNIGVCHAESSQHSKALEYYFRALEIHQAISEPKGESTVLNNIGTVYWSMAQYDKAILYYEEAIKINRHLKENAGASLIGLGNVYSRLGQYDKALEAYKESLPLYREANEYKFMADIFNNIGVVYKIQKKYDKAIEYTNFALENYQKSGNKRGEGAAFANIGQLYGELGQYTKQLDANSKALKIYSQIGDRMGLGVVLTNIAIMYHTHRNYPESKDIYHQALVLLTQSGEPEYLWQVLDGLRLIAEQLKNSSTAIFYGKQAVNTIQSMRRNVVKLEDKTLHTSFMADKKHVYQGLADLLIAQGRLLEAQQVLDMLKEDEYLDYIRRGERGRGPKLELFLKPYEKPHFDKYQEWRDKLTALAREYDDLQRMQLRDAAQEARLQTLSDQLGEARKGFMTYLNAVERALGEVRKADTAAPSEAELAEQRRLQGTLEELDKKLVSLGRTVRELNAKKPVSGLVYYLATKDTLHIILTTHQMAQVARQVDVGEAELNKAVMDFRALLTDPRSDPAALRTAAQKLYGWLIQPIRADLDNGGVTVLMTQLYDTLRYIPFAALHDGKRYLAQEFATALYTPAAESHLKDDPQTPWHVAALGASNPPDAEPLPGVAGELESIVRRDAQDRDGIMDGVLYLDEQFDRDALKKSLSPRYPLLHIASHFRFGLTYDQSTLVLGKGEPMSLEEISYLDFAYIDLLTLSACNTAVGDSGNGSEMEGFGALAQNLGAKGVIAGLWAVSDDSTGKLMQRLYQNKVVNSLSKITALQRAQQAFIEAGLEESNYPAKYAHPYYWAPFILMGNWL